MSPETQYHFGTKTPQTQYQNSTKNPQVLSQNGTKNGGKWYHFSTIFDAARSVSRGVVFTKTGNRGTGRARNGPGIHRNRCPLSLSLSLSLYSTVPYYTVQYYWIETRSWGVFLNVF